MDKLPLEISNGILTFQITDDAQYAKLTTPDGNWESGNLIEVVYGQAVGIDAVRCGKVCVEQKDQVIDIQITDLVWMARFPGHGYLKPDPGPPLRLGFSISLDGREVCFTTKSPQMLDDEMLEIRFPKEPIHWDITKEGHFAGAWDTLGTLLTYPSADRFFTDRAGILPVAGYFNSAGGIGIRTTQIHDYRLRSAADSVYGGSSRIVHEFIKGKSEYDRTVRMKIFPAESNYVTLAKWHRESIIRENRFKSLDDKIAENPEVGMLPGTVIWKHNTFACDVPLGVNKDYSLYVSTPEVAEFEGRPNNWSAKEIFDTAEQNGFDRVCIFNTGWNNKGFDSGFPTRFPPNPERGTEQEFTDAAAYGKSLSKDYIFSVHDNYKDIYPNSEEFTFDEVISTIDGAKLKGGIWRGGRCYILCGKEAIKYAKRDLPHIAKMCGRGAIYLDVQGCTSQNNCYHPDHPGSRTDDAMWRIEIFREAKKQMGALATEGAPNEFAVSEVDIGAFPAIQRDHFSNVKPIPFFQLVYHDCVFNFCGLGFAGLSKEKYTNRVALYGMLPWDFGKDSLRISKELRNAYTKEMIIHEFITDNVEHTVFADGTEVWANFGDTEYNDIPAKDFVIKSAVFQN